MATGTEDPAAHLRHDVSVEILAGVIPLACVIAFVTYILYRARRINGGLWPWELRRFLREGQPADAVVLSRIERGSISLDSKLYQYDLVLEIREAEQRRRVALSFLGGRFDSTTSEGETVPVVIARDDPERVIVDRDALERRRAGQRRQGQIAEEERQRALLDGRDR